jgi:predicted nucleic acid-binding protein
MFDTNVFNRLVEGRLSIEEALRAGKLLATHVQRDELANTKNPEKRAALLEVFRNATNILELTESLILDPSRLDEARLASDQIVPTSSAVWGASCWDEASWGDEDGIFEAMKAHLDTLNRAEKNNVQDILIAETAVKERAVLVTDDTDLRETTQRFGGQAMSVEEFQNHVQQRAT